MYDHFCNIINFNNQMVTQSYNNVKITQKVLRTALLSLHLLFSIYSFCDLNISSHLNKLTPLYSPLSSKKELKNIQFSFFYQFMWPNVFHCVQHYIVIILFTDYTYTVILEIFKVQVLTL